MLKHIIWDFDGTLFDTYPVITEVLRETFLDYGMDEPIDEIRRLAMISMKFTVEHYKNKYNLNDTFFVEYNKRVKEDEILRAKPFEGIPEICQMITATGGSNYLFTHRGNSSFILLEKFGLLNHFRECITSKEAFARKPSPDGILYLIEKYEINQQEAIMIGDRDIDILSGRNGGIATCYFNQNGKQDVAADYYINAMDQLEAMLYVNERNN